MSKLNNIVKISEENYRILEDGGSVGGHSYDPSSIYLVEHDYDLYITNDDLNSKCIVKLHQNSDPGEYQIADLNTPAYIGWSDDNSGETKSYLEFDNDGTINLVTEESGSPIYINASSSFVTITADQLLYNSKEVATVDDLTNYVQTTDSRLSDARTPLSHTHTKSEITDFPSIPTKVSDLENDKNYHSDNYIDERTFTGMYYGANSYSSGIFELLKVYPKDTSKLNGYYYIKFLMDSSIEPTSAVAESTAATYRTYRNWSICELWFNRTGTVSCYSIWNSRINSYAHYYLRLSYVSSATNADFNNFGSMIGVGIESGNNYSSVNYPRKTTISIINISDDLGYEFVDNSTTPLQYGKSNWYNTVKATRTPANTNYNAVDLGLRETGDDNTISVLQMASFDTKIGPELRLQHACLFGLDKENRAIALSLYNASYTSYTANINTDRVYSTNGIVWQKGLYYNQMWTSYAVNSNLAFSAYLAYSAADLRYSDNCVNSSTANNLGIVRSKAVYIKGVIKEDNLFYIRPFEVTYNNKTYKRCWTQDIPTQKEYDDEGYQYVYMYLGQPYYESSYAASLYRINFEVENKVYWYNKGLFQQYNTQDDPRFTIQTSIVTELPEEIEEGVIYYVI